MQSNDSRFSFKNLQPAHYLRNFNRMIDYQQRHVLSTSTKPELKIVSLSKFPLPQYYEKMEGIFENVNKKKVEQQDPRLRREQEESQKMAKHNQDFMRKVLGQFIQHNEERQMIYQKQKKFYAPPTNHLRALSEPRLDRPRRELREKQSKQLTISHAAKATLGSQISPQVKVLRQDQREVLPKLKPRKKREKIHLKQDYQIEDYVVNRKLSLVNPQTQRHSIQPAKDQKLQFRREIVELQLKQAQKQQDFAGKIEKQIASFEKKLNIQIHAINYYNFWKPQDEEDLIKPRLSLPASNQQPARIDYVAPFIKHS